MKYCFLTYLTVLPLITAFACSSDLSMIFFVVVYLGYFWNYMTNIKDFFDDTASWICGILLNSMAIQFSLLFYHRECKLFQQETFF